MGNASRTETDEGKEHSHEGHDHDGHGGFAIFGPNTELYFALLAGVLLAFGFGLSFIKGLNPWILIAFYSGAYFFGGFFALIEAVQNIVSKRFEIDTLMIVAAVGAAALGKWAEGALLLALFSLGHALEHFAMGRAKRAIEALAELTPKTAHLIKGNERVEVGIEKLAIGNKVAIKPNERIPVDGIISLGTSSVNQAPVTGESVPSDKVAAANIDEGMKFANKVAEESKVFAGTINGAGSLEVVVTKLSTDSTLARVIKMVSEAQAEASSTQQFTEKLEKYFVPAVLVFVVLLLFAFLVIPETFGQSFYRAMAVLVAASPCALAIATPSAVLSGIARAGRAGILIKGGAALENLGQIKAMAFDKTGTLTEGKPVLTDVFAASGTSEEELLSVALAVEAESDHPLASAIVTGVQKKYPNVQKVKASKIESITGKGIRAEVDGQTVLIGKPSLFSSHIGISAEVTQKIVDFQANGRTLMVVGSGSSVIGVLGIMDSPRASASGALAKLSKLGLTHLVMLSGDNQKVASAIAKQVGLTEAVGDLMPEDKVVVIKRLRKEHGSVAMVGDGVNDAPAMASATIGIAMGAAGSDVALETADVALMTGDLAQLAFAVDLSRKAARIIRQNLWISLGMVVILIPATISGLGIGPAVTMHEGSTLVVVFNALRLLTYSGKFKNEVQLPEI